MVSHRKKAFLNEIDSSRVLKKGNGIGKFRNDGGYISIVIFKPDAGVLVQSDCALVVVSF
jgi:hypothetical protein